MNYHPSPPPITTGGIASVQPLVGCRMLLLCDAETSCILYALPFGKSFILNDVQSTAMMEWTKYNTERQNNDLVNLVALRLDNVMAWMIITTAYFMADTA